MSLLPMPFPNPRTYPGHSGVDFPQPRGTAIRASGPGAVLRLTHSAAGGYWTVIRYDNGAVIGYAHQDRAVTIVKVGQRVAEGDVIGFVGSLGLRSTGPHLHAANIEQQTYAATMALFDTSRVVGAPAPAGSTSTPTRPATPRRRNTMATLYHQKDSKPARYALAGDSPGTAANWLETTDYEGLAVPWAQVHGNAVTLSGPTWEDYKRRYGGK